MDYFKSRHRKHSNEISGCNNKHCQEYNNLTLLRATIVSSWAFSWKVSMMFVFPTCEDVFSQIEYLNLNISEYTMCMYLGCGKFQHSIAHFFWMMFAPLSSFFNCSSVANKCTTHNVYSVRGVRSVRNKFCKKNTKTCLKRASFYVKSSIQHVM